MKKVIFSERLEKISSRKDDLKGSQIVAFRRHEKVVLENLDLPHDAVVRFDPEKSKLTITLSLPEASVLVLGDAMGFAKKREIVGENERADPPM